MITIRELLNRIRWDRDYGRGEFAIGYFDRLEGRVIVVPLGEVRFDQVDHFSFQLADAAGEPLSIPLHRACEVYRNGKLIWHRKRFPSAQGRFRFLTMVVPCVETGRKRGQAGIPPVTRGEIS